MQIPTAFLFFTALTSTASAWRLVLTMADTRTASMSGRVNTGCKKLNFKMSSPVTTASFTESTFADTFELYERTDCGEGGRVYREGAGTHAIKKPFKVLAYKVY
ncbi:hypothetical protein HOY80DRAFT_900978 [Tuber brumale]|nr:hypothetical protein HOY80DRAFT_900978 [Tuber brumale]